MGTSPARYRRRGTPTACADGEPLPPSGRASTARPHREHHAIGRSGSDTWTMAPQPEHRQMTGDCLVAGLSEPRRLGIVAPNPSRWLMAIRLPAARRSDGNRACSISGRADGLFPRAADHGRGLAARDCYCPAHNAQASLGRRRAALQNCTGSRPRQHDLRVTMKEREERRW